MRPVHLRRRFKRVRQRLRRPFTPRGLILMYHRVERLANDPQLLAVAPEHFSEQLEILARHYRVVSLDELTQTLRSGGTLRRMVALTFDDGYADNLYHAKPLLERYDCPATVFVTTGQIARPEEFWWDELDRLILQPGTLPPSLMLSLAGRPHRWHLNGSAGYTSHDFEHDRAWHVEQPAAPGTRQQLYQSLHLFLHDLSVSDRCRVLTQLRDWSGAGATGRSTHRTLTFDELRSLVSGGLVSVGGHTVNHVALGALSAAEQRDEIVKIKAELDELLGSPVTSFAFPHGSVTEHAVALVRQAGYSSACTSQASAVWPESDPFQLPRMVVRDWSGEEFHRRLKGWFYV